MHDGSAISEKPISGWVGARKIIHKTMGEGHE